MWNGKCEMGIMWNGNYVKWDFPRGKQGSGYSFEEVSLSKSGNEKEWGTSGSSYSKEIKTTKTTGGKRPWE